MTLVFRSLATGARHLPENYLPSALEYLLGPQGNETRGLVPSPASTNTGVDRPGMAIPATTLASPSDTHTLLSAQGDGGRYLIAPATLIRTASDQTSNGAATVPCSVASNKVTVVIDAGIAFWNQAFESASGSSRFADFGFLEFGEDAAALPSVTWIGHTQIDAAMKDGATPEGERKLVSAYAAAFPESVFAAHPQAGQIYRRNGFNHGTAVAALATLGQPDDLAVFGIDLPSSVLLDATGGAFQSVLAIALQAAFARIEMATPANMETDVNIVLPFAFLGGPLDGSHPVVEMVNDIIASVSGARQKAKVFLPTGNHQQDQLHASLGDVPKGQTSPPLRWFLQPDDHAPNTCEFLVGGTQDIVFELTAPDGYSAQIQLGAGDVAALDLNGRQIGAVWAQASNGGGLRVRCSLSGTASSKAGAVRVASGDWTIALTAKKAKAKDVKAWVLRADGNRFSRKIAPARQSYFRDWAYQRRATTGGFAKTDTPDSLVKRAGSLSVLASSTYTDVVAVGADEIVGLAQEQAWYAGQPDRAAPDARSILVDANRKAPGLYAVANGGPRVQRISGTSAASAVAARHKP